MVEQKSEQVPKTATQPTTHEPKPSAAPTPPVSGPLAQFEAWLYDMLVAKAPFQLPKTGKDWIVQYGPWIALVAGILAALTVIPGLFAAITVTNYAGSILGSAYGATVASVSPMLYVAFGIFALQLVVMFISIPMLLKKQRKGWQLLFYSGVISLVFSLFSSFSYGYFNIGSLLGGIIGAAIGFYLIFQIRSYYKS